MTHDGDRRLVAIMFTDMVGYSALAQRNEALAIELDPLRSDPRLGALLKKIGLDQ